MFASIYRSTWISTPFRIHPEVNWFRIPFISLRSFNKAPVPISTIPLSEMETNKKEELKAVLKSYGLLWAPIYSSYFIFEHLNFRTGPFIRAQNFAQSFSKGKMVHRNKMTGVISGHFFNLFRHIRFFLLYIVLLPKEPIQ